MAPNGPQNGKNAIQTLQITIFHDNSGAAQILQIRTLFVSKIAANTNRIRIPEFDLFPNTNTNIIRIRYRPCQLIAQGLQFSEVVE